MEIFYPSRGFPNNKEALENNKQQSMCDMQVFDLYYDPNEQVDLKRAVSLSFMVKMGRPLWSAAFLSENPKGDFDIRLATAKFLLVSGIRSFDSYRFNSINILAVICSSVSIGLGPFTRKALEMASSHLAMIDHYSIMDSKACISYPPDPILAMSSSHVIRMFMTVYQWEMVLELLGELLCYGEIRFNYNGELFSQLLCLFAFNPNGFHQRLLTVKDWLKELFKGAFDAKNYDESETATNGEKDDYFCLDG